MSRIHRYLAERVFGEPVMMAEPKLHQVMGVLMDGGYAPYQPEPEDDGEDDDNEPEDIPVEVIEVHGSLVKRCMGVESMSGLCSYSDLESEILEAATDGKDILLDIDSPGGEAMGVFSLCDVIKQVRKGGRKVYCVASPAYSAAYAIAAACDRIYMPKDSEVGSIGVIAAHLDVSEAEKKAGIKYTLVTAGDHKADWSPHKPLSQGAKDRLQESVDKVYRMFVAHVAQGRGISEQDVIDTQADTMGPDKALPMFADRIGGLREALADMRMEMDSSSSSAMQAKQSAASVLIASGGYQPGGIAADRFSQLHEVFPNIAADLAAKSFDFYDWRYISADTQAKANELLDDGWVIRCDSTSNPLQLTERAGKKIISGILAPYNSPSAVLAGGFREIYEPGCFSESLEADIRFCAHHNEPQILGRTSAGTLRLFDSPDGLRYECELPDTSYARDLQESMSRGDVGGASAAFYLRAGGYRMENRGGIPHRVISQAQLIHGSVVIEPAYPAATAQIETESVQPIGPASQTAASAEALALRVRQLQLAGLK